MSPISATRRLRLALPRRAFAQVLFMQLGIAAGVAVLATGLFLAPLGDQLDDQAMRRALAVAQTTATRPGLPAEVRDTRPASDGPVQREAERIRQASGAEYVVIMNNRGVRWSHPDPAEIGRFVSTDPREVLAGHEVMEIDDGTLGRSARGKVPLRDTEGRVVGAVSVGISYDSVRARLIHAIPGLLAYAGGALAVGALAAWLISRRVHRQTRDLAFSDIAGLLAEREAMLHGIREGVVALDAQGRVRLLNDEAQRLLGIDSDAVGRPLDDLLGPGRTTDVLTGRVTGADLLTVRGPRVLVANRMPTEDGGAVATLRDRTEVEELGRELDSTRGLIDALRAQDHEHANRMHTLLGLLELGLHDEAAEFVSEITGAHRVTAEQLAEMVHDPLLSALLVGKATVAAERGVDFSVTADPALPDRLVDARGLVTIVGNLVDNAFDAVSGTPSARVELALRAEGRTVVLRVGDTGPGVPEGERGAVFEEGWSTKTPPAHGKRGIGLALVKRLADRQGGSARVDRSPSGGAEFTIVLPEALTEADVHEEDDPGSWEGTPDRRTEPAPGRDRRTEPTGRSAAGPERLDVTSGGDEAGTVAGAAPDLAASVSDPDGTTPTVTGEAQ
ncbi:sensor histidine kinase [Streptomyces sp. NA04227]|uniref:sensor histidine kinase n=1 Tax=Streptomyces sp. NA04227 TaxID=2742136 RepID=UPI001590AE72|nr:sensor histidine kinase [Streptomyces sp. NA04227]QKW09630.1 sensor histidine kinase [Streptomyces sp. NA04227]